MFSVVGKVAVVTGASSGLGRRFAATLAGRGAKVVVLARRADRLKELESAYPDAILPVVGDVTDEDDVAAAVEQAYRWGGSLDILVNNAGTTHVEAAEDEDGAAFARVLEVNVTGLFRCCRLVGRSMLERGSGSIVNISSINALVASGAIPEAGYVASKGAVSSLTRELAAQWSARGVRVNALAPGYFPSEMTASLFEPEHARYFRRLPMKRGGHPHELDGPLLFLASDASSYMTGHTLVVDGGWTIV
ncbi:MAG: glucose 1-dehydrogenase [Actinobacteria bacterium]|nr:glucose 1-dehydrogenase [Actinomycetota bacterium]